MLRVGVDATARGMKPPILTVAPSIPTAIVSTVDVYKRQEIGRQAMPFMPMAPSTGSMAASLRPSARPPMAAAALTPVPNYVAVFYGALHIIIRYNSP